MLDFNKSHFTRNQTEIEFMLPTPSGHYRYCSFSDFTTWPTASGIKQGRAGSRISTNLHAGDILFFTSCSCKNLGVKGDIWLTGLLKRMKSSSKCFWWSLEIQKYNKPFVKTSPDQHTKWFQKAICIYIRSSHVGSRYCTVKSWIL